MNDIKTCTYIGTGMGCSKPTVNDTSYCKDHVHIVYQKGTARARRKKDERVAAAVWDLESEFHAAYQELVDEGFDI